MYNKEYKGHVCDHSHSLFLDNSLRRIFQNPKKIVGEYIKEGDTIIDLGCGPGFFSIDMAKMVGGKGKVYSVDLQIEMLDKLKKKANRYHLSNQIHLHQCSQNQIGLNNDTNADFILAYYMVHEIPDPVRFLSEVKLLLKKGGRFLIVEPLFHVSKEKFLTLSRKAESLGFTIVGNPAKKGEACCYRFNQDSS
jgi:ubiquinone/menaquinone biosynthesis C-methylase UbiE